MPGNCKIAEFCTKHPRASVPIAPCSVRCATCSASQRTPLWKFQPTGLHWWMSSKLEQVGILRMWYLLRSRYWKSHLEHCLIQFTLYLTTIGDAGPSLHGFKPNKASEIKFLVWGILAPTLFFQIYKKKSKWRKIIFKLNFLNFEIACPICTKCYHKGLQPATQNGNNKQKSRRLEIMILSWIKKMNKNPLTSFFLVFPPLAADL